MQSAISILFDGTAYAMLLFLSAVGLSITMGLMGFANLAHGVFAMAGGYVTVLLTTRAGVTFPLALAAAVLGVGAASVAVERYLYARFYAASELSQVMMSIGFVFVSVALCTFFFGPDPRQVLLPEYLTGQVSLGFQAFPAYRFFLICMGCVVIAGLILLFDRTLIGAQIRAAVDNRAMAESVGINVTRLFRYSFALGGALAGLGGGLAVNIVGLSPVFAIQYLVQFLIVVAVGGLGSVRGAFAAALMIGIIENMGKYFWPNSGGFLIYAITVAVLLLKPAGLYGKA